MSLSFPAWYKRWPRPMRDALRFALGGLIALCGYILILGQVIAGLAAAAGLLATWKAFMLLRNRRSSRRCEGCDQLSAQAVCPGYALQASIIRQYEEAATELLTASMDLPVVEKGEASKATTWAPPDGSFSAHAPAKTRP